jgi:membrane-bound lytic murein transglycosylase A
LADGPQAGRWRWQHAAAQVPAAAAVPVAFDAVAGWDADDHRAALAAYLRSAQVTGQPVPGEDAAERMLDSRAAARAFFEENFTAFRILTGPGLLTAYFEPVLKGSRRQSKAFPVPVYRRPADLRPLPQGHPLIAAGLTAGRETLGGFEPYATRAEIEAGALAARGLEVLYLADALETFVMHVQGSGFVELDDGTAVRLSFDGKNGHPYTSLSKLLIERGALLREDAHLEGLMAWLRAQPNLQSWLNENKSYAFFRELELSAPGPRGSSGVELYAGRSLAADPLYHKPGTPIWVAAPGLTFEGAPFRRLLVVHDTGSAITGPQRGDVFAGMGEAAGRVAGQIRDACEFITLRPRR